MIYHLSLILLTPVIGVLGIIGISYSVGKIIARELMNQIVGDYF